MSHSDDVMNCSTDLPIFSESPIPKFIVSFSSVFGRTATMSTVQLPVIRCHRSLLSSQYQRLVAHR